MMFCLHYYSTLLICLHWSIVNAYLPCPFDIRIDHYKVDTTQDLVINTPRPQFSWKIPVLEGISNRNVEQIAYQIQLSERDNHFQWDSERVVSSQSVHVPYTSDTDLLSSTYYRFRLRVWITNSKESSEWTDWIFFRTPIFNLHEYITSINNLLWIGSTKIHMNELRKEFTVSNTSSIKSAIVYLCGLGYYQFYLNGKNVDPSRKLDPGWTTYEKRTLFVSFDITANITIGTHAVGVKLGNGWYAKEQSGPPTYGPPRLLFTLNITFENGEQMQVVSDQTWTGREGSIKHDSVYHGEFYDCQNDRPNWSRARFNDSLSAWIMAESLPSPINSSIGILVLQDMPPIRAGPDALHFEVTVNGSQQGYLNPEDINEIKGASFTDGGILKPVDMWKSDSNLQVFDLGQNTAGWCRLSIRAFKGPSGFSTHIRYAEVLVQSVVTANHSTRNVYTENLRGATQTDTYMTCGDSLIQYYEPTFTVHGFRYLSVFRPSRPLTIDDVECLVVHSETTLKGHFTTSNPIVNQIQHNIQWGQLSNLMSLPTDSPQRDERRGYLGDAALAADEALYNFDLIKFYLNFLNMIVDSQAPDGALPGLTPPGDQYPADPNWGTALPTISWQLYKHYGDVKTLEAYYYPIRAYIEYLRGYHNKSGLINFLSWNGDWVPPSPHNQTNLHLTGSFAFLHDVNTLLNMSEILGKTNDTQIYSVVYQQLADEFHRVFFSNISNFYSDGMQAAQVLALALPGVVPTNLRGVVVDYLANNISQNGNHVTTGIVSTAQIYPVLSDNGHHDLALEMISSITYPSYGFMFTNPYENATTIWELWDAPFEGPSMNSRNHQMYASVGAWFYSHLAGLELSSDMITIRPRMASETKKHLMSKLDCQLSTLYGLVHISYTRDERDTIANSILLRVAIPPNARARVMFEPLFIGGQCQMLLEGNKVIWSSAIDSINYQEYHVEKDLTTGLMTVHIGSGQYEFQAVWK